MVVRKPHPLGQLVVPKETRTPALVLANVEHAAIAAKARDFFREQVGDRLVLFAVDDEFVFVDIIGEIQEIEIDLVPGWPVGNRLQRLSFPTTKAIAAMNAGIANLDAGNRRVAARDGNLQQSVTSRQLVTKKWQGGGGQCYGRHSGAPYPLEPSEWRLP